MKLTENLFQNKNENKTKSKNVKSENKNYKFVSLNEVQSEEKENIQLVTSPESNIKNTLSFSDKFESKEHDVNFMKTESQHADSIYIENNSSIYKNRSKINPDFININKNDKSLNSDSFKISKMLQDNQINLEDIFDDIKIKKDNQIKNNKINLIPFKKKIFEKTEIEKLIRDVKKINNFNKSRSSQIKKNNLIDIKSQLKEFITNNPDSSNKLTEEYFYSLETFVYLLSKINNKSAIRNVIRNKRKYKDKNVKSNMQLLCFKYYFLKIKSNIQKKEKIISKLQVLTKMTSRQIYKWLWDEKNRYKYNLIKNGDEIMKKKEQQIILEYKRIKEIIKYKICKNNLWILNKIFIPHNPFFSERLSKQIWKIKLKGIIKESFFLDLS